MAIRILLLLLSLTILVNIVILLVSFIFNVNLYEKHGKIIRNSFGIFYLLVVITYAILAIVGLV